MHLHHDRDGLADVEGVAPVVVRVLAVAGRHVRHEGRQLRVAQPELGDTAVVTGAGLVGQFAAQVRKVRPPNAYKEKGIRYSDEVLHFKPGKAAARKA